MTNSTVVPLRDGRSEHLCPICALPFSPTDLCATDIEMGTCHFACLEGSPVVDLETGEPTDGVIGTFTYGALG